MLSLYESPILPEKVKYSVSDFTRVDKHEINFIY